MATAEELATLYQDAIDEIDRRYRFKALMNVITPPTVLEKEAAVVDAIAEFNSYPPETSLLPEHVLGVDADPRIKTIIYLGAARNIARTLLMDWVGNAYSVQIEEFSVESKKDDYDSLMTTLTQQFENQLQQFKTATGKFIRRVRQINPNPLVRFRSRSVRAGIYGYSRFR
jgi:hypothetical protein